MVVGSCGRNSVIRSPACTALYQLRVVLRGVSPLVLRQLPVASETSVAEFHEILLLAFDWSGEHLHRFRIHGRDYGTARLGGLVFDEDARKVPLSRFRLPCGERFRYEYDFTAGWTLDVRLEQVLPWDPKVSVPVCTAGRRAAPPEDCARATNYLEWMDRHRRDLPLEDLAILADAMQRFLDSGGNRGAMGNLAELREALESVTVYRHLQPDRLDRRETNRRLQASWQDREGTAVIFKLQVGV